MSSSATTPSRKAGPRPQLEGITDRQRDRAYLGACILLGAVPLEPTSALKQAASDEGIPYGAAMGRFVVWAQVELQRPQ